MIVPLNRFQWACLGSVAVHLAVPLGAMFYGEYLKSHQPEINLAQGEATVVLEYSPALSASPTEEVPLPEPVEVASPVSDKENVYEESQEVSSAWLEDALPMLDKVNERKPSPMVHVGGKDLFQTSEQKSKPNKQASLPSSTALSGQKQDRQPRLVRCPVPPYPREARLKGREGVVHLLVYVDVRGNVTEARLVRSSGREDFDHAAISTVKERWKFEPGRHGGAPVASKASLRVRFVLEDS